MWKKEESEWSEPVVLRAAGKKQMSNLGMAFEELVKNIGEKAHPEMTWTKRAAGQDVPGW
ncbi:unnamed protein product, partial [Wuchereria bancrofti]